MDSVIIFCAKYLFVLVPLLFVLVWRQAGKRAKNQLVLALVTALVAAVILDKIGAKLYYDPRPFAQHGIKPLISHAADNGFPSEHTLFSVTIGAVMAFYRRRLGLLAIVIALVVGIARVAAHVHSPVDIIGAALMGAAAGTVGYYFAKRILMGTKA